VSKEATLKTVERKTSVTRSAIREAFTFAKNAAAPRAPEGKDEKKAAKGPKQ
jgi:hypothetical protein